MLLHEGRLMLLHSLLVRFAAFVARNATDVEVTISRPSAGDPRAPTSCSCFALLLPLSSALNPQPATLDQSNTGRSTRGSGSLGAPTMGAQCTGQ